MPVVRNGESSEEENNDQTEEKNSQNPPESMQGLSWKPEQKAYIKNALEEAGLDWEEYPSKDWELNTVRQLRKDGNPVLANEVRGALVRNKAPLHSAIGREQQERSAQAAKHQKWKEERGTVVNERGQRVNRKIPATMILGFGAGGLLILGGLVYGLYSSFQESQRKVAEQRAARTEAEIARQTPDIQQVEESVETEPSQPLPTTETELPKEVKEEENTPPPEAATPIPPPPDVSRAEKQGYDQGMRDGRIQGFSAGQKDGYAEGKRIGRQEGMQIGRQDGYRQGQRQAAAQRTTVPPPPPMVVAPKPTPLPPAPKPKPKPVVAAIKQQKPPANIPPPQVIKAESPPTPINNKLTFTQPTSQESSKDKSRLMFVNDESGDASQNQNNSDNATGTMNVGDKVVAMGNDRPNNTQSSDRAQNIPAPALIQPSKTSSTPKLTFLESEDQDRPSQQTQPSSTARTNPQNNSNQTAFGPYRPFQVINAKLQTAALIFDGGNMELPPIAISEDGHKWIGSGRVIGAQRVNLVFDKMIDLDQKVLNIQAAAYDQHGLPGIQGKGQDLAPDLVRNLLRSTASGVRDYAQAEINATKTRVKPDGSVIIEKSKPSIWSVIGGRALSVFDLPKNEVTFTRAVYIPAGTPIKLIVGASTSKTK